MWYNPVNSSARVKEVDQVPQDREKPWVIREVAEQTRRDVKAFASVHGLSVAEALEYLVHVALSQPDVHNIERVSTNSFPIPPSIVNNTAAPEERDAFMRQLAQQVAEVMRKEGLGE